MLLAPYFDTHDGSLPEVVVAFPPGQVRAAFRLLFDLGARDASAGGGATLWVPDTESERTFSGPEDLDLVLSGRVEPFHILLGGIAIEGCMLPDLGVFVDRESLVLDYRMGDEWDESRVRAFLRLLGRLRKIGGVVAVPWWGPEGERAFMQALSGA